MLSGEGARQEMGGMKSGTERQERSWSRARWDGTMSLEVIACRNLGEDLLQSEELEGQGLDNLIECRQDYWCRWYEPLK